MKLSSSETGSDSDGNGPTVAQHPELRVCFSLVAVAKTARHIAQRLIRNAQDVVSLIDDDPRRRGHAGNQRQIAVIDADDGVVGHDVLHRLRRLTPLRHDAMEHPLRKGVDGKGGGVADLDAADIGFRWYWCPPPFC